MTYGVRWQFGLCQSGLEDDTLVPHTGFSVNRLMPPSRIHRVRPGDACDARDRTPPGISVFRAALTDVTGPPMLDRWLKPGQSPSKPSTMSR